MSKFQKYLLFSLIFALLNAALLMVFFLPRFDHSDTKEYAATIKYVLGDPNGQCFFSRMTKPLPILIGAFLSLFLDTKSSLLAQNLVFYFLSIYLIFVIIYYLYHSPRQAFYGTILFSAAYPMLAYGLAPLTDLAGWFFYLLVIFLSLKFLKRPNYKRILLIGFVGGIGMLFKESLAVAPIFFASFIFIATSSSIKKKLKYLLVFAIAFLIPVFLSTIVIYQLYSYSLLDWYINVSGDPQKENFYAYSFLRIMIEIVRVLIFGWLFVFWGIFKEFRRKNIERIKILAAFIPASLAFFIWPYPHNRIIYIAAPLLILLASFGLLKRVKYSKIKIMEESILLFIYVLINYFFLNFFLNYGDFLRDIF